MNKLVTILVLACAIHAQQIGGTAGGGGTSGPSGTPTVNDILTSNGTANQVQDPGGCTLTSTQLTCPSGAKFAMAANGTANSIGWPSEVFYSNATRDMRLQMSSVDKFQWLNGPYVLDSSTGVVGWGIGGADTGLSRISAGTVGVGNGSQGSASGQLNLATLNPSSGIIGVSTNSSAPAGDVGELAFSQITAGSAVSLTSGTAANVTSVNLTAGDWDCSGAMDFSFGATTSVTNLAGSFSQTSATMGPQDSGFDSATAAMVPTAANPAVFPMPSFQELVASTTTVFFVAKASFAVSTASAFGTIRCRRMR